MKVVVADVKAGKCYQRELPKDKESLLIGKKLRDSMDGSLVGLPGFTLKITGGSDVAGVPMRTEITGQRRIKALLSGGTGIRNLRKGGRKVKVVAGNTISLQTAQLNTKIAEYGAKPLEELGFVLTPKEKKEKKEEKAPAKKKK